MTQLFRLLIVVSLASIPVLLYASAFDVPVRHTGAPGDLGTCVTCHGGTNNSNGGSVTATFSSGTTYTPGGGPITINVVLNDSNPFGGFQMTARLTSNLTFGTAGRFIAGTGTSVYCQDGSFRANDCPVNTPVEFIQHFSPRDTKTWTFTWSPPATNVGSVRFYIGASAVNNNGFADNGDHPYTTSYVLTPAGAVNPTPDNALIVSQIVGGGSEWHTTLSITNLSNADEDFALRFFDDDGLPKFMPIDTMGYVDTITGTLAPAQTRRYETGAAGELQIAWALLTPGTLGTHRLSGLAVFRQSLPSGLFSEASVDFSPPTQPKYVLLFDNLNGFDTTVMLANPDILSPVTILADIHDEQGNLLSVEQIQLPALGHTAFVLRERFPITVDRRGSIRLAASPRGFAGLGLRFSPFGTFTSFRLLTSADIQ